MPAKSAFELLQFSNIVYRVKHSSKMGSSSNRGFGQLGFLSLDWSISASAICRRLRNA
jgi:hypothetical protein